VKDSNLSVESVTCGLQPIERYDAETLILGSLPSKRSIQTGEYFAHPRNVFWRIMGNLVDAHPKRPYPERVERLIAMRLAIWDVLESAIRPGSLDAAIQRESARPNNFRRFLREHLAIQRVCFNGQKAASMFERLVLPGLGSRAGEIQFVTLPSTSPAHAAMTFEQKLCDWSILKKRPDEGSGGNRS